MRRRALSLALAAGCALGMTELSRAGEADVPAEAEVPARADSQNAELIAGWLRALGLPDFDARREASRKLVEAGAEAADPVARAAETSDLETAARCLDILKRMFTGRDAAAKKAAEQALKRLSESGNRSIAQRAADLTRKPDPTEARGVVFGNNVQIQVQIAGGVLPAQAVPVQRARPVLQREATVEENGKKIRLQETVGREIVVQVTETVDGKPKTTEYKAANPAELLQKHPEAYALYRKHLTGKPVQANGGNPQPANVPANGAARNFRMQVRTVNNQREVEVDDGQRKVQISDSAGKDIVVRVTERVDGKEKTTESKGKDLEELKKNHPEAGRLYEQYGNQKNGVRAFGGAIQIQGGIQIEAVPAQAIPIQVLPIQARPIGPIPAIPDVPAEAEKP